VQAVGAVVVGGGAVAAELGTAGDADGALPVPAVLQGRGDLVCGGAGQVGLDHQHVGVARGGGEAVQPGPVEGARGGGVGDGDVEALGGGEDPVQHRPDGDDDAGRARGAGADRDQVRAGRAGGGVAVRAEPEVDP